MVWLNTLHMHSIQPCYPSQNPVQDEFYACVHMDDDVLQNRNRSYSGQPSGTLRPCARSLTCRIRPRQRRLSLLPMQRLVGESVALSVAVTDPDFGDSWTYEWSESDATMRGGAFSDASAADTAYTPAADGTVVVQVRVTDDAGQATTAVHTISVTP